MRSATRSIDIDAPPEAVFAFVADLERLPVWAIGFAKAIERGETGWTVTTASGERVAIAARTDAATGVVDYVMRPAPGVELPANTRVVPREGGSAYVFTLFQAPEMDDDAFERQAAEVGRELTVLKAHLESACPL
jgi:hypothetical protein